MLVDLYIIARSHSSHAERYRKHFLTKPFAWWHTRQATKTVITAYGLCGLGPEQIYWAARLLIDSSWWLGGDEKFARSILTSALNHVPVREPQDEMLPETRALMLLTLAECEATQRYILSGFKLLHSALKLLPDISDNLQKIQILKGAGLYYKAHADDTGGIDYGNELLYQASELASRISISVSEFEQIKAL